MIIPGAIAIGIGATLLMDLWNLLLKRALGIPSLNYCLLGRWVRHLPGGTLRHTNIAAASPKSHECTVGWIAHYTIGVVLALVFVALATGDWLDRPTMLPALLYGIGTVVFPFFILQPSLGLGIASSKTPNPTHARVKSLVTHTVFGVGLYVWGLGLSFLSPLAAVAPAPAQDPCTIPAAERPAEVGCYFTAAESIGTAPSRRLFWHLHTYPSRSVAESARRSRGIVVEAFDSVWLYTIAERDWRPSTGHRVAVIGPLATTAGRPYVARYMEAVFLPGMRTRVHRHSGAEAWYVLSGAQCLETPEGIIRAGAGESAVVSAGPPMVLSPGGQQARRAVLLVLHDAAQPWTTADEGWEPRGACPP